MNMKGILLINLGSPKDLELESIKEYLKEFLLHRDYNALDVCAFSVAGIFMEYQYGAVVAAVIILAWLPVSWRITPKHYRK